MRPHVFSKILSVYDRLVHHQAAPAVAEVHDPAIDVEPLDLDVGDGADTFDDTRATTPLPVIRDEGELYGIHTPPASDRDVPDDDRAFGSGQTWTEALEERAAEGGPTPEHEIDVVDETEEHHPNSETKDRPIADLGSGGRGGL